MMKSFLASSPYWSNKHSMVAKIQKSTFVYLDDLACSLFSYCGVENKNCQIALAF